MPAGESLCASLTRGLAPWAFGFGVPKISPKLCCCPVSELEQQATSPVMGPSRGRLDPLAEPAEVGFE